MKKVLITGGTGFIGSHIADQLLNHPQISFVRVLDNLSTSSIDNIAHLINHPRFEFQQGDIRNFEDCQRACASMDLVTHQAALGSVPRSIDDPLTTNAVNVTGSLHVLHAAKEAGIKRLVYAASSSTYGDNTDLPKMEDKIGKPLSPYAVTKYVNELYASVYSRLYGMEVIGLRYFNVFGPRQSPNGAYAAVIPLFISHLAEGKSPVINGDGSHSRDFTFVFNTAKSNLQALFTGNPAALNQVFNIAYGRQTSLLQLFETIRGILNVDVQPLFGPERTGDIRHSLASIQKARKILDFNPTISVVDGLKETVQWFQAQRIIVPI